MHTKRLCHPYTPNCARRQDATLSRQEEKIRHPVACNRDLVR